MIKKGPAAPVKAFLEKYDGRGQIIIERGQFFKTYLYGAGYDQAHFKIMERGHLTS